MVVSNFFSRNSIIFLFFLISQIAQGQENIFSGQQTTTESYLYVRKDFEINLSIPFSNPYDATEIALDLVLISPSVGELILPCFYTSGDENQSVWNAHFLPQEIGTYSYRFQLSKNKKVIASTENESFTVLPSAKNGIFHANNNWTFKFDSGKPFRGIGENVGWEAREWENQSYTYDYFLPKLAKSGVNFFRTWMCPWNLPIEWETVQDTKFYSNTTDYFNPDGIRRMDELVEMTDSLDMHMMLALIPHGALITSGEWSKNPYNIVNGGPASTPVEFFTLDQSKQKFKNTLRYLVARWGYSPGIGVWEFCNEIDNAAYNGGSELVIPEAVITQWHTEMSEYLNEIDIYNHPISTSISHREIQGLYSVPDIDFNQQHIYRNTSAVQNKIKYYQNAYGKPYVIGEFGWDWDWNNVSSENGSDFDFDLKRGLWYGLFTSTPIVPMSWWWEFFDGRNMTSYYHSVTDVSAKMLLAGAGSFKSAAVTSNGFEKYAVQCGSSYFIYLLNNSASGIESEVSLNVEDTDTYYISSLNPSTNNYSVIPEKTSSSGVINLGAVSLKARDELIFIISLNKELVGIASPYLENNLPGRLEAENYDNGMDGLAFHDFDNHNSGGVYRENSGVDIYEKTAGFFISDIVEGEWLRYSVNLNESGIYSASAVVSSSESGKSFRLLMNGIPISEVVEVPQTGEMGNWVTVAIPLQQSRLDKGRQQLKLEFLDSDFAVDYLVFELKNRAPVVDLVAPDNDFSFDNPTQINLEAEASDEDGEIAKVAFYNRSQLLGEVFSSPYEWRWEASVGSYRVYAVATDNRGLTASSDTLYGEVLASHSIPGTIEAEDYDVGENGTAYFDLSSENKFGFYRNEDVDLEECSDENGGFSVGDFQSGEWLNYTVQVKETGDYRVDFRVATQMDGAKLSLSVDGDFVAESIDIPNTGGWQVWATKSIDGIHLEKGVHVIKLGDVTQYVNVNHFIFSNVTSSQAIKQREIIFYPNPVNSILYFPDLPKETDQIKIFNNLGELVLMRNASITNINVIMLPSGVYNLLIISTEGQVLSRLRFLKY